MNNKKTDNSENNNIVFDDDEIEQEITDIDFEDDEDDF